MQSSAPTTPTKRSGQFRQKEILTTPKQASSAKGAFKSHSEAGYVRPVNFDDETLFSDEPVLQNQCIQVGNSYFTYGRNMAEYKDSTTLYRTGAREALLKRLEEDGYILIRGAINAETAKAGRMRLINHLAGKGAIDTKKGPLGDAYIKGVGEDGWTVDAETGGFVNNRESEGAVDGWREIGWCKEVRSVYDGPDIHALFRFLWGQPRTKAQDGYVPLTQNTWLRAKANGEVTSEHADYYYFKQNTTTFQENRHPYVERDAEIWNEEHPASCAKKDLVECDICLREFDGTQQFPRANNWDKEVKGEWHCHDCASQKTPFYTCWIALGEYTNLNSTLAMMPKSHHLTEFDRPLRTDLLPEDYNQLVKDKWGWLRADFQLGDLVLFNWKTVHGASKNTSDKFRFSIDTRVSSSWLRPKGLWGDDYNLKYNYPAAPARVPAEKESGAVPSIQFLPESTNNRCPCVLSSTFLAEQEAANKAGVQRRRKIGNISSRPKVMGMGGGMGGGNCKPSKKGKKAQRQDESEEEEESDESEEEEEETPKPQPRRGRRGAGKRGADGVGRFGDDDESCQSETDHSQDNSQQSGEIVDSNAYTPRSRRQHRILRETEALELKNKLPIEIEVKSFNLEDINEESQCALEQAGKEESEAGKNVIPADDDKKKKTRGRNRVLDQEDSADLLDLTKKQRA